MAVIRRDPVGRTDQPDNKTIYEFLVDEASDLAGLTYVGEGSMAYARGETAGERVYVFTNSEWVGINNVDVSSAGGK